MNDGPSPIDPLVAEGPLAPVDTLRPAPSLQRIILLDEAGPMMVDLESGDVRRYESGPPVSVPMVSDRFDLSQVRRLQIQLLRDPRPSSVSQTLLSLDVSSAGMVIDVRATPDNVLEVSVSGAIEAAVSGPLGASPAVVVVIETQDSALRVSARNADTLTSTVLEVEAGNCSNATLTVGGPSSRITGTIGRRRTIPVQVDLAHHGEPIDQLRRGLLAARRLARSVRDKRLRP